MAWRIGTAPLPSGRGGSRRGPGAADVVCVICGCSTGVDGPRHLLAGGHGVVQPGPGVPGMKTSGAFVARGSQTGSCSLTASPSAGSTNLMSMLADRQSTVSRGSLPHRGSAGQRGPVEHAQAALEHHASRPGRPRTSTAQLLRRRTPSCRLPGSVVGGHLLQARRQSVTVLITGFGGARGVDGDLPQHGAPRRKPRCRRR